jgi:hypothetical protein
VNEADENDCPLRSVSVAPADAFVGVVSTATAPPQPCRRAPMWRQRGCRDSISSSDSSRAVAQEAVSPRSESMSAERKEDVMSEARMLREAR